MKKSLLPLLALPFALIGCTTQSVVPLNDAITVAEVCVLPDYSNYQDVYRATVDALTEKGFFVREIDSVDGSACADILQMKTKTLWSVKFFTSDIDYTWYRDDMPVAEAHYHADDGLNVSKYIDTRLKVNELLNTLLPGTPPLPEETD